MIEFITAKLGVKAMVYAGAGIGGVVCAWLLKRIPNEKIRAKVGVWAYRGGVLFSLNMGGWKYTRKIWGQIELWFIDAIDNIVVWGLHKFIEGMRSDNKK